MSAPVFLADAQVLAGTGAAGDTRDAGGAGDAGDAGDVVVLDGPEGRHASVVRRVRPGEEVVLTDGQGTSADCVVTEATRSGLTCRVLRRHTVPSPQPRLVAVQALPKGERAELAVQMLTEVGADVIVPWPAARCVVRWRGDRGAKSLEKWRSHAREAAKQARRSWLPHVAEPASTAEVAGLLAGADLPVVLHESGDRPVGALDVPVEGDVVLVVGPEGGLTGDEVDAFAEVGAAVVRLGPTVFRTSTAGVVAAAVLLSRTPRWT